MHFERAKGKSREESTDLTNASLPSISPIGTASSPNIFRKLAKSLASVFGMPDMLMRERRIEATAIVQSPKAEEERWHLCFHVLACLDWFRQFNGYYGVVLPPNESELGQFLKKRFFDSPGTSLDKGVALWNAQERGPEIESKYYKPFSDLYEKGANALRDVPALFEQCKPIFRQWHDEGWFHLYPCYRVFPTPWGCAGTYVCNADGSVWNNDIEGRVFVRINSDEQEIDKERCPRTAIHEIVHLGVEETLVRKYHLSHQQKERLVDMLCAHVITGMGYWMQSIGDRKLDPYLHRYLAGESGRKPSLELEIQRFKREQRVWR